MYSCFDDKSGSYRYFSDDKQIAINADLPIPSLPSDTGNIGVPSIEAGRPLPMNAQYVGQGFFARGMVVQCGNKDLSGAIDDASNWVKDGGWKWLVAAAAVIVVWRHL